MVASDAKVCLVTGSSRGLGKAIALELGKHGQKVVVNYVSEGSKGAAEATVKEIMALGGDAMAVQADSTYPRTPSFKHRRDGNTHLQFLLTNSTFSLRHSSCLVSVQSRHHQSHV
jgi:3-oxoacyl-[acyl-carrier protein] reductase